MDEESDDDFNFIRPKLLQQLRTILDQYPDDEQILKVKDFLYHYMYFSTV